MTRVFFVDDHAVVRRGLKQIVEEVPECQVVGEAATAAEGLAWLRSHGCDVVVLDVTLPDGSGLDLLKQIKSEFPRVNVLVLTMHSEEQYAVRALRAGAAGYLTKESAPDDLVTALRKVASGGRYLSPTLAERLAFQIGTDDGRMPHERLSDREFQVLCLMASGHGMTEIGTRLGVSVKTVSTHRTRILQKMGLRNNAELIHYAIKHGLVT